MVTIEQLEAIALDVKRDIDRKQITVLAHITEHEFDHTKDMKHGAYAVGECWDDLSYILDFHIVLSDLGIKRYSPQHIELIDTIVDKLKQNKLIYLEW